MKNHQGKISFFWKTLKVLRTYSKSETSHRPRVFPSMSLLRFSLRVNFVLLILTCASYYNIDLPDDFI